MSLGAFAIGEAPVAAAAKPVRAGPAASVAAHRQATAHADRTFDPEPR